MERYVLYTSSVLVGSVFVHARLSFIVRCDSSFFGRYRYERRGVKYSVAMSDVIWEINGIMTRLFRFVRWMRLLSLPSCRYFLILINLVTTKSVPAACILSSFKLRNGFLLRFSSIDRVMQEEGLSL